MRGLVRSSPFSAQQPVSSPAREKHFCNCVSAGEGPACIKVGVSRHGGRVAMSQTNLENSARATAGHYALQVYHLYGPTGGEEALRGVLAGVVMAAASVIGWDETRRIVGALDAGAHLPPPGSKPHLVVVNDRGAA